MDNDLFRQGTQVDPSGPSRSTGRARRSVPHQVPARRVHGATPSPPLQFSSP